MRLQAGDASEPALILLAGKKEFSALKRTLKAGGRKAPNSPQPCFQTKLFLLTPTSLSFKMEPAKCHQGERRTIVVMYMNQMASIKCSILKCGLFFFRSLLFGLFFFFSPACPGVTHLVIMMHAISWQAHFGDRHAMAGVNSAGRRKVPEIRMWNQHPGFGAP